MFTELQCWFDCYGEPLTVGALVKTTSDCEVRIFDSDQFMITSITFEKGKGISIGINGSGKEDDFVTAYDCFRINELELVTVTIDEDGYLAER